MVEEEMVVVNKVFMAVFLAALVFSIVPVMALDQSVGSNPTKVSKASLLKVVKEKVLDQMKVLKSKLAQSGIKLKAIINKPVKKVKR